MPKKAKVDTKEQTLTDQKEAKSSVSGQRKIKSDRYQSFRLQKRIQPEGKKLPNAFRILVQSLLVLKQNWKLFLGIVLIYGVLNIIFVQGLNAFSDLTSVKDSLGEAFSGNFAELAVGTTLFLQLITSSGNTTSAVAGAYQLMLVILVSLALIWSLRQVHAKNKVRVRDSFYLGMYPLVPFILVLLVVGLQLIPALIGVFLQAQVSSTAVAVTAVEQVLWAIVLFVLVVVSLYMLCSSLFALYIVSLPDMTPISALRAARNLVRHRRWIVMRKIIMLPIILIVLAAVIIIPLIIFATPAAPWVLFALNMAVIALVHSYMYTLYRELL